MNTYRLLALVLLTAAVALSACKKQPVATDDSFTLATVNNQEITEAELLHYMKLRPASRVGSSDAAKERREVLEEMVDRALLAQRAEAIGVDRDPKVQLLLKRMRENILVTAMVDVSDDELRARFDKEFGETHKTEYLVRHILVREEDEARELIKDLQSNADFAGLAKRNSIDVLSVQNGGRLGWINEGMVVPELFDAVTRLKKGAYTREPVKSDLGWHVIKVEGTRPARLPSFDEFMADPRTRNNFYTRLRDEKIEKLVQELRAQAKIDIHDEP
jgi:peptidyl-prolyl cis-trans isomerase C